MEPVELGHGRRQGGMEAQAVAPQWRSGWEHSAASPPSGGGSTCMDFLGNSKEAAVAAGH
eukprot:9999022-Alexandrium_andersonii.AAC.1